jgi:hypothetical protein
LGFLESPTLTRLPHLEADAHHVATARIEHYIELVNARFQQALPEYDTPRQLKALDPADHATA